MLKSLLARLPLLRKSQEFFDIIPELERQLTLAEAAAVDLKADLKRALFESPEKSKTVKDRIADNGAEQESLRLAIDGARERQKEAAQIEMTDEVIRRIDAAKDLQSSIRTAAIELHKTLVAAATQLNAIKSASDELRAVNAFAIEHGRRDLKLSNPIEQLLRDNPHGVAENPLHLVLHGYFPPERVNGKHGPVLAKMRA